MTASLFALLLLLAPVTPESARFTIKQDGRTIGTERFTIQSTPRGYLAEAPTELNGNPNPLTSRMELDENLNPVTYEYSNGQGSIRIKVQKPTSELTVSTRGNDSSTDFRFPDGGMIVDNNFFHHYLLLLYRIRGGDQTLSIFVPQDMQSGLARIRSTGNRSYALDVGDVKLEATVDGDGRLMRLAVPAAKVVVER